jgi:hypothetical protein
MSKNCGAGKISKRRNEDFPDRLYIIVGASRRVSESHAHLQVLICALCRICGSIALAEFLQLAGEGFEVGAADGDAKQGGELAQIPYPADRFLQAFKP